MAKLDLTDYYEPAWIFASEQLSSYGSAAAVAVLKSHLGKTSPAMFALYEQRFPMFHRLLKNLTRKKFTRKSFTLIRNGEHSIITDENYQKHKDQNKSGTLFFNAVTGLLIFSKRKAQLKPGSILHRILVCLLSAFPEAVELETLYEMVWGGKYEPEYGKMAVKAAMLRLRKTLQQVCPTSRVEGFGVEGQVRIILESPFEAIF